MKLNTVFWLIVALALTSDYATSQIQIDKPVELTGSGSDARVTGIQSVTDQTDATSVQTIQSGQFIYAQAQGTANDITLTLSPPVVTYTEGMMVNFKCSSDNTGPVTLNVNGLGAIPIKKYVSSALGAGDLLVGQVASVVFDGTNFQLVSLPGTAPVTNASNLDYSLSVSPTSTFTNPGYSTSHAPVTIDATLISGFNPVSLSVSGLPSGVTYSISPGGGFPTFSATLVFHVGEGVAPGNYPVNLIGTGGIAPQTVPLSLQVYPVRRVFLSQNTLPTNSTPTQRDVICNSNASGAGLTGTFKAWVSNGASNNVPSSSSVSYRLVNNNLVAWDWNDLTDGSIANPIHIESGGGVYNGTVYTGLNNTGSVAGDNCSNWSSILSSQNAVVGSSSSTTQWSNLTQAPCGTPEYEIGETLNSAHCSACGPNVYYTVGTCGSGCGIYNLNSSCVSPPTITWGPFTYYNCMQPGEAIDSRFYCFEVE